MTRRQVLYQRRRMRAMRLLKVEYAGGTMERMTCHTCARSHVITYRGWSSFAVQMRTAHAAKREHVGCCPHCTKDERERRYPLKALS